MDELYSESSSLTSRWPRWAWPFPALPPALGILSYTSEPEFDLEAPCEDDGPLCRGGAPGGW